MFGNTGVNNGAYRRPNNDTEDKNAVKTTPKGGRKSRPVAEYAPADGETGEKSKKREASLSDCFGRLQMLQKKEAQMFNHIKVIQKPAMQSPFTLGVDNSYEALKQQDHQEYGHGGPRYSEEQLAFVLSKKGRKKATIPALAL